MTDEQPWYLKNYVGQFKDKPERRLLAVVEAEAALEIAERNAKRDKTRLHSSQLAKNDFCPLEAWYELNEVEYSDPEYFNMKKLNTFTEGHSIHDKWQRWMYQTGNLVGLFRCPHCSWTFYGKSPRRCPECEQPGEMEYREVPLHDDEHMLVGHADGEWHDRYGMALVEIKSVGLGTIRWDAPNLYEGYENGELTLDDLWKRIKRPLIPHRRQIGLYMHMRKIHNAIVIYEWKPTQEIKEFHVRYEPELVQPMLDNAKLIVQHMEEGTPPPKPEAATHKSCNLCKFCPYKNKCWPKKETT